MAENSHSTYTKQILVNKKVSTYLFLHLLEIIFSEFNFFKTFEGGLWYDWGEGLKAEVKKNGIGRYLILGSSSSQRDSVPLSYHFYPFDVMDNGLHMETLIFETHF